jgi:hypothetical protein
VAPFDKDCPVVEPLLIASSVWSKGKLVPLAGGLEVKFGVVPLAVGKAPASVAAAGAPTLAPPVAGNPDEESPEEPDELDEDVPEDVPEEVDDVDPEVEPAELLEVSVEPDELEVEPVLWLDEPEGAVG